MVKCGQWLNVAKVIHLTTGTRLKRIVYLLTIINQIVDKSFLQKIVLCHISQIFSDVKEAKEVLFGLFGYENLQKYKLKPQDRDSFLPLTKGRHTLD